MKGSHVTLTKEGVA
ncbi:hypothetical protein [Photorhabdus temperata]